MYVVTQRLIRTALLALVLVLSLLAAACSPQQGSAGPPGPTGDPNGWTLRPTEATAVSAGSQRSLTSILDYRPGRLAGPCRLAALVSLR